MQTHRSAKTTLKVGRNRIKGRKSQKVIIFRKTHKKRGSSFNKMVNILSCYNIGSQLDMLVILNQKTTN